MDNLQRQLDLLNQPRSQVLTVPVNIMRSAHGQVPDVIVQKPAGRAAILLDIELGPLARKLELLEFALVDEAEIPFWPGPRHPHRMAVLL